MIIRTNKEPSEKISSKSWLIVARGREQWFFALYELNLSDQVASGTIQMRNNNKKQLQNFIKMSWLVAAVHAKLYTRTNRRHPNSQNKIKVNLMRFEQLMPTQKTRACESLALRRSVDLRFVVARSKRNEAPRDAV